jgi:hypothetical protein
LITFTSSSAAMDGPTFKQTTNKHTNTQTSEQILRGPARRRVAARTAAPKHRAVRQAAAVGAESVKSARRVTAQRRGRRWGRRHCTLTPIGLAMPRKYSMCAPSSRTSGVRLFAPMPFLPPFPSRTAAPHRSGRADARPSAVAWTGTSVVPFAVAWSLRLRASASHALRCAGQCKPWARAARSRRQACVGAAVDGVARCTLVLRTTDTYRTQRTTHAAHSNGDSARHTARSVPPQRSAQCFALRSGACGRRSRGSARRGCTTCSPPAAARPRRLHAALDMLRTAGRRHHSGPWRAFIGAGAPRVPRVLREYPRVRHPPCG